ncbi:hypothetical protein AAMO2058_001194700 [Amorphochlora amoebiformis]|uniref:Globin domain-containing protein n=1 Tax=Amorphochlora amoebiformis TaxID=1561963 RepID=A0A7S0H5R5_9EUKA|mmetsp:Transcript_4479/g.6798  ORF Transcript_4479/g.6798 Transcript_4479/m.6798 type:complete len:181 (+) Transcript_4479:564-1106(+)
MGAENSSPVVRYRKELLKLSWRVVLTIQDGAEKVSQNPSVVSLDGKRQTDNMSIHSEHGSLNPFHEDFGTQFFKYCPDLKNKFPTDYSLVSKMITTFISNAIDAKDIGPLARRFGRTHVKHDLSKEHFEGFSQALVDTLQHRLGKFGTIELVKIWREVTSKIVKAMEKEYVSNRNSKSRK